MPKEEAHLPVSAGEHEVRAQIGFFFSPTETVDVESGGERHLLVRPSPVPSLLCRGRLRSSYLCWIDAQPVQPLTGSALLNSWYLRSVLLWAALLVGYFFEATAEPHLLVFGLFPSWFLLVALAIGLVVSSIRALRRN
jgi:hypothetical protein